MTNKKHARRALYRTVGMSALPVTESCPDVHPLARDTLLRIAEARFHALLIRLLHAPLARLPRGGPRCPSHNHD
jgi:hypothetical protein